MLEGVYDLALVGRHSSKTFSGYVLPAGCVIAAARLAVVTGA